MISYLNNLIANSVIVRGTGIFQNEENANRSILTNLNFSEKFCEKISFNTTGQKYAIAIGYNPSLCNINNFDLTNQLLCYYLQSQRYDGYYLLNIFSNVSVKKSFNNKKSMIKYFQKIFNKFNNDIYIFWGRSVYVNKTLLKSFQNIKNQIFTIGNTLHAHQHPGRNTSFASINSTPRINNITLNNKHHLI